MIYRGTTPTNIFTPDIDLTEAEKIEITYSQYGEPVLKKTLDDITFDDGKLVVLLSQEDTLSLGATDLVIRIRAKLTGGVAVASDTIVDTVKDIEDDEVI